MCDNFAGIKAVSERYKDYEEAFSHDEPAACDFRYLTPCWTGETPPAVASFSYRFRLFFFSGYSMYSVTDYMEVLTEFTSMIDCRVDGRIRILLLVDTKLMLL